VLGVGLRRSSAPLQVHKTPIDPLRSQLFLHGVLRQPRSEPGEVDLIDRLILIEA
jgi:hypothetical protein